MDLFAHARQSQIEQESPLANRMRPRTLDEFVGQDPIVGPGRLLRRAIQADQLSSLIFYGPPGTGKTTLAAIIANSTRSHFITINAVLAGIKEIRQAIDQALERRNLYNQRTTLFVDEVHRWNKAQQDALLPHVENGTIILIGATTANPYFEVIGALVSRSRIFQLRPLRDEDLRAIAMRALADEERGYGRRQVKLDPEALDHLVHVANGDARGVLNALELAVETTPPDENGVIHIDLAVAEESIQRRAVLYDKDGDIHYDTISAFIKSLRGSDPDAALYWMARMLYAGEDPRFIFRRMAILAGEDVGLADPQAVTVVNSCWELFERVGMPEGRFHLAEAALYLATCPKSNSTLAFFDALALVEKGPEGEVPNALKDGNRDKEGFGHGQGYLYPHAYRDHWVAQPYLPASLQGKLFYQPGDQGYEKQIREQVTRRREAQLAAMLENPEQWTPQVLTTNPANRQQEAWLQRVISRSSGNLASLRQRLFELARVERHHLLLVFHAGSGLLAWEAVRQAPEGGVWILARDAQAAEALAQQAARLPELERPHIQAASPATFDPGPLRFDRLLARNPVQDGRADFAPFLPPLLAEGGQFVCAQTIPRRGQRLYERVEWQALPAALRRKVQQAEEEIFSDTTDPLVNWDEETLVAALKAAGFGQVQLELITMPAERRISAADLQRWFATEGGPGGRPGYGQRLRQAGLSQAEVARVAEQVRQALQERTVSWQSTVAFLQAWL